MAPRYTWRRKPGVRSTHVSAAKWMVPASRLCCSAAEGAEPACVTWFSIRGFSTSPGSDFPSSKTPGCVSNPRVVFHHPSTQVWTFKTLGSFRVSQLSNPRVRTFKTPGSEFPKFHKKSRQVKSLLFFAASPLSNPRVQTSLIFKPRVRNFKTPGSESAQKT